jgi:uncharacterized protein YoxC
METELKEVIDILKNENENLTDKSNTQYQDICILRDKLNTIKKAFKCINDLIQATTKTEQLMCLKDASILMLTQINKL